MASPPRVAIRCVFVATLLLALHGDEALSQSPFLVQAETALGDLEYETALGLARSAAEGDLTPDEWVRAHEIMAFSYSVMDSTAAAITAFREVVYSDPDRTYDADFVSPAILGMHTIALGRELVIRNPSVDSTTFRAGSAGLRVRFQISRPANVQVRITGPGVDIRLDSLRVATGFADVSWNGLGDGGSPLPEGVYDIVITAAEFSSEYSRGVPVAVRLGTVDTVSHLAAIPGLEMLPEFEQPGRGFMPLQIAAIAASAFSSAVVALEGSAPNGFSRRELFAVDGFSLLAGIVLSLRKPPPRLVPSNLEYNRRVTELVIERNDAIAVENETLRRQVLVTVVPVDSETP